MQRMSRLIVSLVILACLLHAAMPALAQEGGEEAFIAGLLPKLSPEAKIGQLFVVAFSSTDATLTSEIADLIRNYQVGGVMLSSELNDFNAGADTPVRVAGLTGRLQ